MGLYRIDYIVYGWKLPYNMENVDFNDENKFLPMIEGREGEKYSLINDDMTGSYRVFGLVLTRCEEGWDFEDLCFENIDSESLINKYEEVFNVKPITEPTLFIFSHYS